ncbi:rhodanese-like domain-containing protein [Sphingobium sp. Cam5-1]|uniref:rhodanese-like domain-containing protein n=1 Tax=Sphingobium sp. Cam5-1 TaxID=2789327 RepID=UPI0018AD2D63|nr:rhodanese-like domain-containing protein [Sphingobium sp. Cam5-1]QPI72239.1 rhodanese-like domain-containing protein [Sphingobium sp. Cam5-1]
MPISLNDMLAEACAIVPRITPEEARQWLAQGDVLIVDVRDSHEVAATGKIKGAVNVSRGMIEFRAAADTPYHDPAFRKDSIIIVYCASGGRSALAGKILKDMGYEKVHNLGGFNDAKEGGFDTEPAC